MEALGGSGGQEWRWVGSRAGVAEPGEEGASSLHQDTPEAEGPSPEGSGLWGGGFAHPEPLGDNLSVTAKCVISTWGVG